MRTRQFPWEYQMDAKDWGPAYLKIIAKYNVQHFYHFELQLKFRSILSHVPLLSLINNLQSFLVELFVMVLHTLQLFYVLSPQYNLLDLYTKTLFLAIGDNNRAF